MNNKKKILYLITVAEHGGAQTYVLNLVKNFAYEFDIFVGSGGNDKEWMIKELKKQNISWYKISFLQRKINIFYDILAIFYIRKLIKQINPDIIHLNSTKISILASLATWGIKTKIIYTVHGWVWRESISTWKKKIYLFLEKKSAKIKDIIIYISQTDQKEAEKYNITSKKEILIYNGINTKNLNPYPAEQAKKILSQKYNIKINPQTIIVGSVANLYKTKNLEVLIKAASKIINKDKNWQFIVIGNGPQKKLLNNQIIKLNLQNNFHLIGNIDKAMQYITAYDIFVLPSTKEGMPFTILEAMAMGLPIISTPVGGIPEILSYYPKSHYRLGNPNDCNKLVKHIKSITKNKLLKNSLTDIKNKISINNMLKKTKAIYLN